MKMTAFKKEQIDNCRPRNSESFFGQKQSKTLGWLKMTTTLSTV